MEKTLVNQQVKDEAEDFAKSGRKLNEVVEEEVEVPVVTPIIDEKNKRVSFETKTQKVKQKTFYSQSTPRRVICSKHHFVPENLKKYLFKCDNDGCDYHFQARIPTHKYNPDKGELIVRMTGRVIT